MIIEVFSTSSLSIPGPLDLYVPRDKPRVVRAERRARATRAADAAHAAADAAGRRHVPRRRAGRRRASEPTGGSRVPPVGPACAPPPTLPVAVICVGVTLAISALLDLQVGSVSRSRVTPLHHAGKSYFIHIQVELQRNTAKKACIKSEIFQFPILIRSAA